MSDEENEEGAETMFTCKKCPGKFFKETEKEEHRMFHRTQRETRASTRPAAAEATGPASKKTAKTKPGPKSKKQVTGRPSSARAPSPTPSTATLFSIRHEPPEDMSQQARSKRATKEHRKNSKKTKTRVNSG